MSGDFKNSPDSRLAKLLERRQELTEAIEASPYDLVLYIQRAAVYSSLEYPDLACGDAYRALLLTDEVINEGFEYHGQAVEGLEEYSSDNLPEMLRHAPRMDAKPDLADDATQHAELVAAALARCFRILSLSLLRCDCLKSAYTFCERGLASFPDDKELLGIRRRVDAAARSRLKRDTYDAQDLPDSGLARREVYPWNTHEPDRFSEDSLTFLNAELAKMAPKCVVKASELPILLDGGQQQGQQPTTAAASTPTTCKQLGVFAAEDIAPGEVVLREFSALTANNRLQEPVCDACGEELPELGSEGAAVECPDCSDAVFCGQDCFHRAMELYHPAVCDLGVDSISKDPEAADVDHSLYLLLLARLLAMAAHQDLHPLDVREIKYIWGDFVRNPPPPLLLDQDDDGDDVSRGLPFHSRPSGCTLPFSFKFNVEAPLHVLERMDVDIYATLARHDVWVLNTCYANTRDGRPDVAAVHPFWCLANHDCDPNVTWEWGGKMCLKAREQRVAWVVTGQDDQEGNAIVGRRPAGIKAGEEVLNHYCDVDMPVQQRREWASGSLGGWCMCQRCRTEAAAEASLPS
ncbi:hypothetical protein MAPG_06507 [Magnaporthiopsis poae ATCC 64411]|uniref:SET domain-containing protein n=1 Tax=Magnaporthiopsis poae (strain ATCC 64411 / 73-15) TaxID=644358 RepID=A0A0C4E278_MAGP6|nr:hypothetical protein MAPG_06507 [Magnaporthiopsis poae ATCC 64411]